MCLCVCDERRYKKIYIKIYTSIYLREIYYIESSGEEHTERAVCVCERERERERREERRERMVQGSVW